MNMQITKLVKTLLHKDSLDQCSLQELEQYADRHPYFGAAQLLLTKKLKTENSDRYDEQLQKTFLFFHNPLWVEHLLNETGNAEIIATEKEKEAPAEPVITAEESIPIVSLFENKRSTEDQPVSTIQPEPEIETAVEKAVDEPAMQIPPLKMEAIDPGKTELVFEPFHTVDYFASLGIKLKEDEKPRDKFSQQLKSFTDWLKTMKRLPVSEIIDGIEPKSEEKVEQLAQHSLTEREVVTEAMAEVWEKQGNVSKAIEIYNKLSLLEPAKSLYFAAKIEDLKKIN